MEVPIEDKIAEQKKKKRQINKLKAVFGYNPLVLICSSFVKRQ